MNKNLITILTITSFFLFGFTALAAEGSEIQIGTSYIIDGFNQQFINGKIAFYYHIVEHFGIGVAMNICKDVNGDTPYFLNAVSLKLFVLYLNLGISDQVLRSTGSVTFTPHKFSPVITLGAGIPFLVKDDSAVSLDVYFDLYCVDRRINTDIGLIELLKANAKLGIGITSSFGL